MSDYEDLERAQNEVRELRALVMDADSLCSLIFHREASALSEQTLADLGRLVYRLRMTTDKRR